MSTIKLSSPATREFWEVPILYEDAELLAVDKPAGLLTSPDPSDPNRPNLMTLLHAAIVEGKAWTRERGLSYLMNAHRLDFETSGVLLLAKNKQVLTTLANLFGSEKPNQRYVALVQGAPTEERFSLDVPLAPHPVRIGFMRVDRKHGKRARTIFEVSERFKGWALLACQPLTCRTHQIRAHLRHAGLPIAGDALYGGKPLLLSRLKPVYRLKPKHVERPLIDRVALHAEQIILPQPASANPLTITAPWPKDLAVAMKYLRKFAAA